MWVEMRNMTSEYHLALKKEQLVQLLSNNTKTTLANSFLALLLTYVLWNVVPQNLVTIWITVLISVNFIRFLMGLYFINHPEKEMKQVSTRLNCFRAGACISAIVWGMSNLLVFDHELDKYQFLVAYLLAGISAGAAVAYSTDLISALAFTFLTIVPMVIIFISSGDPEMMAMAAASSAYLVFMPLSIKMFNAKLIEGIHLRWDAEANAKAIEQLAFYDELTSLPNRRLLLERMQAALLNAERNGSRVALMFIDLDRFKTLNDEYGHDMGDLLLQKQK